MSKKAIKSTEKNPAKQAAGRKGHARVMANKRALEQRLGLPTGHLGYSTNHNKRTESLEDNPAYAKAFAEFEERERAGKKEA